MQQVEAQKALTTAATKAVDVVDKVTTELLAYLKDAVQYGKEQVPSVVSQYIRRELWEWSAYGVLWLILAIVCWKLQKSSWKAAHDEESPMWDEDELELTSIGFVLGWLGCGVFSIGVFVCIFNLVSVWIAPKVFVLEKLSAILKGN